MDYNENIRRIIFNLKNILFYTFEQQEICDELMNIEQEIDFLLKKFPSIYVDSCYQAIDVLHELPKIKGILMFDIDKTFKEDPSCREISEVILSFPGFFATFVHRIAHEFYRNGFTIIARMFAEFAHHHTGIDIHPGASIGPSFFIDHGTGVVIGETAIIGTGVSIYHGVTLGVLSFEKDEEGKIVKGTKRHPTIEDNVTLYAECMILGGKTIVGKNSVIGSGVVIKKTVAPNSKIISNP